MALDLALLVRNAVSTVNTVTASLQGNVLHAAWAREDAFGKVVYAQKVSGIEVYSNDPAANGVAASRPAIIELQTKSREVGGRTIITYAVVTFLHPFDPFEGVLPETLGRKGPVDPRDHITLPNGKTGPIVDIQGFMDAGTSKPFFVQVWLGALQERGV
jgi:hypothetical protein